MLKQRVGRADCGNFEIAAGKEWLVTNGLGGFAAGTLSGANTRRYHGLLVAKIDPIAAYGGVEYALFANEFAGGAVDPQGYRHLESFHLNGFIFRRSP